MAIGRRGLLRQGVGAAALAAVPRIAWAVDYPTRPVHVVDGFVAGGPADVLARLMGQWLSERLGQPFVIDNKPGAATNIATEYVAHAPADGYTLLWITSANTINATLYDNLNFNFLRDVAPVASFDRFPLVMEVNSSVPAKSVSEFIAYAKSNPGKINYGSGGVGSIQHVACEMFRYMAGVDLIHVPYRGSALVLNDLLAGRLQVTFSPVATSIGYIRSGAVRALAVTGATRSDLLPDVPTVGEYLPGYEASAVDGIGVPRDTPAEIIATLNRQINAALADPVVKSRIADLGSAPLVMSSGDFGRFVAAETEKWAKVIKFANIRPE
jgi:tripartite-type tricarboxylate transporter receptor subunit TctC